jgi:hypothetical protein
MVEEVAGATTMLVIVLAYVLIVQAMTAAVVLLAEFIVLRVRALRSLLAIESQPEPARVSEEAPQAQSYRVSGGLLKW